MCNKELKRLEKKYIDRGQFVSEKTYLNISDRVSNWGTNLSETLLTDEKARVMVASLEISDVQGVVDTIARELFPLLLKSAEEIQSSVECPKKRLFPREITSDQRCVAAHRSSEDRVQNVRNWEGKHWPKSEAFIGNLKVHEIVSILNFNERTSVA